MIEVEDLLAPVSADNPCGPDLEYDEAFIKLEKDARGEQPGMLARPGAARDADGKEPARKEPEWSKVQGDAADLLRRSKNLRVAVLYARASARVAGADGLLAGLTVCNELVDRYWNSVHPHVEPGAGGPFPLANAIASLADPDTMIRDVRAIYLVRPGRVGRVSVRDVLVATGRLKAGGTETALGDNEIKGVLVAAGQESIDSVAALRRALDAAKELEVAAEAKIKADNEARGADPSSSEFLPAPNLAPLRETLAAVVAYADKALSIEKQSETQDSPGPQATGAPGSGLDELRTRDDAARLIGKLCEFIERTEPTNPAPYLLRRAGKLMNKNFMEIIHELAPGSVEQIENIVGTNSKPAS